MKRGNPGNLAPITKNSRHRVALREATHKGHSPSVPYDCHHMEHVVVGTSAALTTPHVALLILGGLGAGIFNGVAGGGSLISFPVLLALGYPALTANITNTVGIWPGYLGSAAGFRRQIADQQSQMARLAPVAVVGAILGAI